MNELPYSQGKVNRIFADVPKRTIHYWAQLGLLEWAGERQDRRGTHRHYTLENLWQIGLMEELALLGTHITGARNTMKWLSSKYTTEKSGRAELWETCSIVLWRNRPEIQAKPVSTHPATFIEPESIAHAGKPIEVPGWDGSLIVPNDSVGDRVEEISVNSLVIVTINLRSIQVKVERFLERAGLS